jgi:hypothetical protein
MNIEQYKEMIKAERAKSLRDAILALTKANNALTNNFNVEENN